MLAIVTAATKGYLFAWKDCIQKAIAAIPNDTTGTWIVSSDRSKEGEKAFKLLQQELPKNWEAELIQLEIDDDTSENYKVPAQIRIARLQGAGFQEARKLNPEYCLSLESDVLVRADVIRLLTWSLQMPAADGSNYYDVAMATYPNGQFLGGRGDYQHPIGEDFTFEERQLPDELKLRFEEHQEVGKGLVEGKYRIPKEFYEYGGELEKQAKQYPPRGSIWDLNAKFGWRKRGWLEFAYPAVGLGALLPTDWVGLGCTLLTRKGLALADFSGYQGQGTQDLFLCWNRWHPAGLRMAVLPHSPCDHVKPERDKDGKRTGKIKHMQAYHEPTGEAVGHLRVRETEYISLS